MLAKVTLYGLFPILSKKVSPKHGPAKFILYVCDGAVEDGLIVILTLLLLPGANISKEEEREIAIPAPASVIIGAFKFVLEK